MFPKWFVKVHPKYGTPWIAIIFVGIIFTIFATNAFAFLVVADVFLHRVVIVLEFIALCGSQNKNPDLPRITDPWRDVRSWSFARWPHSL